MIFCGTRKYMRFNAIRKVGLPTVVEIMGGDVGDPLPRSIQLTPRFRKLALD
jgi:hypothetical protein